MKPSSDCDYGNPHFHLSRSVFLPFLSLLFVLSCFSYFTYASTPCLQSVMDCCNAYASSINTHTHQDVELSSFGFSAPARNFNFAVQSCIHTGTVPYIFF